MMHVKHDVNVTSSESYHFISQHFSGPNHATYRDFQERQ